jgi:hypothetical protein
MKKRLGIGALTALLLAFGASRVYARGSDYNSNPAWCHQHSFLDDPVLYMLYECWLPDPPSQPG